MKSTLADEKLAGKISEDDKATISSKIDETTSWLDANQTAEKEEYEAKQKELEAIVNPILQSVAGGGGDAGGTFACGGGGWTLGGRGCALGMLSEWLRRWT